MKYLIVVLFSFLSFVSFSQDDGIETDILKKKKYYNSFAFDFNMNGSNETYIQGGGGFRVAAGYKMNRWINVGAGSGFEFYNFENNTAFIPLFAEVKGELADWKVVPFYSMEMGIGFRMKSKNDSWENKPKGFYFRPQLGWKFKGKNDFATTLGFGYLLQKSSEDYDYSWGEEIYREKIKRTFQRYFFQVGFEF